MSKTGTAYRNVPLGTMLTDVQPGFASGRHNSTGEGIPHFRPMNVTIDGRVDRTVLKFVDPAVSRPGLRLSRGDVIFNNTNSPELVGKTALFDDDDAPAFSNHMTRLRVNPDQLDPGYLALRLHQAWREGWFAAHCNNHVSQASIGRDVLRAFEIEVPPLEVQRAITSQAAAIEARRSSSITHLAGARRAIGRFRQAVLAAACSGRLTADWRLASSQTEDSASRLARHHAENPDIAVNQRRTRPARGLAIPNQSDQFPSEWAYNRVRELVALGVIVDIQDGNHGELYPRKDDFVTSDGVPYISAENVDQEVWIDRAPRLRPSVAARLRIGFARPGDVILTHNATVGRVAILPQDSQEVVLSTSTTYYRMDSRVLLPEYLVLFMRSPFFQRQLFAIMEQTTRNQVSVTKQVELFLALPTVEEQRVIVERSAAMLGSADRQLSRLDRADQRLDHSAQAVLAKAFRGDLVLAESAPEGNP